MVFDWFVDWIWEVIKWLIDWVQKSISALWRAINGIWQKVKSYIASLFNTLKQWVKTLINGVYDYINKVIKGVYGFIGKIIKNIQDWTKNIVIKIYKFIGVVVKNIKAWVQAELKKQAEEFYSALSKLSGSIDKKIVGVVELLHQTTAMLPQIIHQRVMMDITYIFTEISLNRDEFEKKLMEDAKLRAKKLATDILLFIKNVESLPEEERNKYIAELNKLIQEASRV